MKYCITNKKLRVVLWGFKVKLGHKNPNFKAGFVSPT